MLKIQHDGIMYNGKKYIISKNDIKWILSENKRFPLKHPARNLKSVSH